MLRCYFNFNTSLTTLLTVALERVACGTIPLPPTDIRLHMSKNYHPLIFPPHAEPSMQGILYVHHGLLGMVLWNPHTMFHGQLIIKYRRTCCYRYNRADASERVACSFPPGLILPQLSGDVSFLKKQTLQVPPKDDELDRTDHMTKVQKT